MNEILNRLSYCSITKWIKAEGWCYCQYCERLCDGLTIEALLGIQEQLEYLDGIHINHCRKYNQYLFS